MPFKDRESRSSFQTNSTSPSRSCSRALWSCGPVQRPTNELTDDRVKWRRITHELNFGRFAAVSKGKKEQKQKGQPHREDSTVTTNSSILTPHQDCICSPGP
jgi:hypothetical protein